MQNLNTEEPIKDINGQKMKFIACPLKLPLCCYKTISLRDSSRIARLFFA